MEYSFLDFLRGIAFTIQMVLNDKCMIYDHEVPVVEENIGVHVVQKSPSVFTKKNLQVIPKHDPDHLT
jgi:hypothetical protein